MKKYGIRRQKFRVFRKRSSKIYDKNMALKVLNIPKPT